MSDEKNDGGDEGGTVPGCPGGNFVIPGPALPNGDRICVAHKDGHQLEAAVLHHAKPGEPMPDDAVLVSPMEGTPYYEIGESVADLKRGASKGPSRVNSKAFRDGWDGIFGKRETGQA